MAKTIGILGGMGPLATADLFRKITLLTKASCDNEHIRVYIDSNAQDLTTEGFAADMVLNYKADNVEPFGAIEQTLAFVAE